MIPDFVGRILLIGRQLILTISVLFVGLMAVTQARADIQCEESWQGGSCEVAFTGSGTAEFPLDGRVPFLQSFNIEFSESARPIRRLELGAVDSRSFRFALLDRNGGENIEAHARFVDMSPLREHWREACGLTPGTPIITIRTASERDCRGSCVIAEEENPHVGSCRWSRYITGFSLRFTEPRARKLRQITIDRTESGRLEATFRNDGDRQIFDVDVGYVDIPIPGPPEPGESPLHRVVQVGNSTRGSVPDFPGGGRVEMRLLWGPSWWQNRYIRGFEVRRTHDDGNLRRFSIDVQEEPVTVRFEDNDGREDVTFSVLLGEFVYRIE